MSYVTESGTTHYNKPTPFFCKLTLNDNSVVELEGSGGLTKAMTRAYSATCVGAEIGTLCTSIGEYTFNSFDNLSSVIIPNSVVGIGGYAFGFCTNLASIIIPNSVTGIGGGVFEYCYNLASVTVGSGISNIGDDMFEECRSLSSVIIPDNIMNISNYAFRNCSGLTRVTLGSGLLHIGLNAFSNCSSLTSIISNATTAPAIEDVTFVNVKTNGTLTVPSGSSGYDTWMSTDSHYLGYYNWTKVEQ